MKTARRMKTRRIEFKNARDVRVFGQQAVVLDDAGFHLIDADLKSVSLIARRKISVQALSLSRERLAISYDIGGLCRIMDVSAEQATEVGRFDKAKNVQISPDGHWVACQRGDELQVFDIRNRFEIPSIREKMPTDRVDYQWLGTENPRLLSVSQADDGGLTWKEIDPQQGQIGKSKLKLPAACGVTGDLDNFAFSPVTKKYLALTTHEGSTAQFVLWAISPDEEPRRLGQEQGLRTAALNPVSVSFSEIDQPDIDRIGTRMAILTDNVDATGNQTPKTTKLYLLSRRLVAPARPGGRNPKALPCV